MLLLDGASAGGVPLSPPWLPTGFRGPARMKGELAHPVRGRCYAARNC